MKLLHLFAALFRAAFPADYAAAWFLFRNRNALMGLR